MGRREVAAALDAVALADSTEAEHTACIEAQLAALQPVAMGQGAGRFGVGLEFEKLVYLATTAALTSTRSSYDTGCTCLRRCV